MLSGGPQTGLTGSRSPFDVPSVIAMYGDPDAIERLAGEVARRAAVVDAAGAELISRFARALWTETAADAFRADIARRRDDCAHAAGELRQLAGALRVLAADLRADLAAIRQAEQAVLGVLARGGEQVERVAGALPHGGAAAWVGLASELRSWGLPM